MTAVTKGPQRFITSCLVYMLCRILRLAIWLAIYIMHSSFVYIQIECRKVTDRPIYSCSNVKLFLIWGANSVCNHASYGALRM